MIVRQRLALLCFWAAVCVPFLATFAFFICVTERSLLTDPRAYIRTLKRTGTATYMVSLPLWKHYLARDPLCRGARAIVIGSSRVREIDSSVLGTSTCNLYEDGLAAGGFESLARALPALAPGDVPPTVYVGIDHFWLWSHTTDDSAIDLALLARSPALWRAWRVAGTLGFFEWRDVVEAARRVREGRVRLDQEGSVWFADGHLYHPQYYARKRAGLHDVLTAGAVQEATAALFGGGRIDASAIGRIGGSVRLLHAKGYVVRAYWNPVSAEHIAAARRRYPSLFDGAMAAVDRLAASLPLDRYLGARVTLDATRFGCTDQDYFDPTHVDVDCMRRVFAAAFGTATSPPVDAAPSRRSAALPVVRRGRDTHAD